MSEQVNVRILLLFGDQAEVVADAAEPTRYPASEIAEALGAEPADLPGMSLTALVRPDDRLTDWQQR